MYQYIKQGIEDYLITDKTALQVQDKQYHVFIKELSHNLTERYKHLDTFKDIISAYDYIKSRRFYDMRYIS